MNESKWIAVNDGMMFLPAEGIVRVEVDWYEGDDGSDVYHLDVVHSSGSERTQAGPRYRSLDDAKAAAIRLVEELGHTIIERPQKEQPQ